MKDAEAEPTGEPRSLATVCFREMPNCSSLVGAYPVVDHRCTIEW